MCKEIKCALILGFLLIVLGTATPLFAEPELHFDGEIRLRSEFDHKSFSPETVLHQYNDLRTRFGIDANLSDRTNLYLQFQDSRRLGENSQSGSLTNSKNVDIHQAYINVEHLWSGGIGLKAGRFELNYGNQRVFGSVGWHSVGRSWEGIMAFYSGNTFRMDAFFLKLIEQSNNRDFDITGIYTDIYSLNLHFFAFYELDNDKLLDVDLPRLPKNILDRINVGSYYHGKFRNFDVEFNGVYQFGEKFDSWWNNAAIYYDIRAFLFTFEVGYTFPNQGSLRLESGIDYSSGDDNTNDRKYTVYQNSYYTGHKFRGYMDYFISGTFLGLIDIYLGSGFSPANGWDLKAHLHYFRTDKKYDRGFGIGNDLGYEMDFTCTTTRIADVRLEAGASIFLPEEKYNGTYDKTGYWLYGMITANFKK